MRVRGMTDCPIFWGELLVEWGDAVAPALALSLSYQGRGLRRACEEDRRNLLFVAG